jgi:hypothetical protein
VNIMRPKRKYVVPGWLSWYSDSLQAERPGDRIPVGARFPTSIQNGPGAHAASYTMGTGSFRGVKRPERRVDHPPASCTDVTEIVELYFTPSLGFCGDLYLYLTQTYKGFQRT